MAPTSPAPNALTKSTDTSVCETLISVQTNEPATTPETSPGDTVLQFPCEFGDYLLLNEVARGGMGVVYRARQKSLDRIVALKMIRRDVFDSPEDVERFHREARMSAALDHPHIVPVYEVREAQGRHYFTMAYVEGSTLKKVAQPLLLQRRQILEWMTAIVEAVQFAHERGIIHRDLKPDNVLIDGYARPRVTDFGLAKRLEANVDLTSSGRLVGTPSYMAPEQALPGTHPIGPATDVYGLGGILYYLLAGRPPAVGASLTEVVMNVVQTPPPPPRNLNPAIDLDLQEICLKCLAKNPDDRYPTALALLDALKALPASGPMVQFSGAAEVGASTVPLPTQRRATNSPRRRAPSSIVLAIAAVFLVVFLWLALFPPAPQNPPSLGDSSADARSRAGDGKVPGKPGDAPGKSGVTDPSVADQPVPQRSDEPKPEPLAKPSLATGKAQNDFLLHVSILGARPDDEGRQIVSPGSVAFEITSEKNAFVTLWSVDESGEAILLFPNSKETDNEVKANQPRRLSGEGKGYHFPAVVSTGPEVLIAFATAVQIPGPPDLDAIEIEGTKFQRGRADKIEPWIETVRKIGFEVLDNTDVPKPGDPQPGDPKPDDPRPDEPKPRGDMSLKRLLSAKVSIPFLVVAE